MSLCQCGCGGETPIVDMTSRGRGRIKGQPSRFIAGHNLRREPTPGQFVYKQRYAPGRGRPIQEQVVVAERVLGKVLPSGVEVHHVDGNTLNNANRNLVICEDKAYHKLLHWRERIIRRGGNPNVGKFCSACDRFLPFDAFNVSRAVKHSGRCNRCRECSKAACKNQYNRKKAEAA